MATGEHLERGRAHYRRREWRSAHAELTAADRDGSLPPGDLVLLAMSAYLMGRDAESLEILTRAHREHVSNGDIPGAVRCAFWLGFQLVNTGDMAQAGGWFGRGASLLAEVDSDHVERGYLLIPQALQNLFGGDPATALETFAEAADIGRRFGDPDLIAFGNLGRGQSLIKLGTTAEGLSALDEVMVSVTTGEVAAIICGLVYCAVIEACHDVFDLRRAQEWTGALTEWCASQPDLVPFRGQCLVHRAQVMALHGDWTDAEDEAVRAHEVLSHAPDRGSVGMAAYEIGELQRLRGDFTAAEESYREASRFGHPPQPGLAKLRLAQGQVAAAVAASRRMVDEARNSIDRCKVLPAHVEIMLAADDVHAARAAADELTALAEEIGAPLMDAISAHAHGAVLLAEGDARAAVTSLRRAWQLWQELEAPYEASRVRVLSALACRALGDEDGAVLEFDAARWAFDQLGAGPDRDRVDALAQLKPAPGGLTGREIEVLVLVATGKTNREIAQHLVISEKTVARHLSNIFTKLGVTSRSAATAYAYEHGLT